MSMEVFKEIVEAAKQQELEIEGQRQMIEQLESKLESMKEVRVSKDITIDPHKFGDRPRQNDNDESWDNLTLGITGLTSKPDLKGKIMAKVHFKHPLTGRDTTKSKVAANLVDAIIARNEIAAVLLKDGLINLEQFGKYTVI